MRPTLLAIPLALLTTLAVAWSCALVKHPILEDGCWITTRAGEGRAAYTESAFGVIRLRAVAGADGPDILLDSFAPSQDVNTRRTASAWWFDALPPAEATAALPRETTFLHAAGWPRTAFYAQVTLHNFPPFSEKIDGGFGLTRGAAMPTERILPYRPVWSGLLVNTALFAFIWATVLYGVPAAKRTLRLRRGKCPKCGYALAGLKQCPECGAKLA